ncbi:MAG: hypothetical protein U1F52_08580 [Burkholderiales bacterium]
METPILPRMPPDPRTARDSPRAEPSPQTRRAVRRRGHRLALVSAIGAAAWLSSAANAATVQARYYVDRPGEQGGQVLLSHTLAEAAVDSGMRSVAQGDYRATARADLAGGKLGTSVFADARPSAHVPYASMLVTGDAYLDDFITLALPPASAPVPVTVVLAVDGAFDDDSTPVSTSASLLVNASRAEVTFDWAGSSGPGGPVPTASVATTGTVTGVIDDPAGLHALLVDTVMVRPGQPVVISATLSSRTTTREGTWAFIDFSHTAALSIEAPPGISFTSGSGLLLTTPPVPEPATWQALLAGFAAWSAMALRPGRGRSSR